MSEHKHALRRWREEHEVTLAALASMVDVEASHLSMIERGIKSPSLGLAVKLSKVTEDEDGVPAVPLTEFVKQETAA